MRTFILGVLFGAILVPVAAAAQSVPRYPAPTKTPKASTAAQERAIGAGIDLHDQGKFDDAIARYQDVLKENPDDVTALFELAFSYHAKREYQKSLDTAGQGMEYKSDLLAMFYDVTGNALDSMGEPDRAIAAYKRGTELVPDAPLLYFNMAVTYHESLKDSRQARLALEKSIALEPDSPEAHRLLGQIFQADDYRTPAFLSLATFLVMAEDDSRGALQGYGLWRAVLKGNTDPALANIPSGAPKVDEGDFTAIDALFETTYATFTKAMDDGTPEIRSLIAQVDTVLTRLSTRDAAADSKTFIGRHYVPYFVELKQKNFVEPFTYWVSQRAPVPGVKDWIVANEPRVREFLAWSNKYVWAK